MDNVNKTLYIPLYGKAYVSQRRILLEDPKAEEIWNSAGFPLKGKAKSKWLAYNMGMRGAIFDRWALRQMKELPDAVVLHMGCGLDSRNLRIGNGEHPWFDVDFPEVIAERKRHFAETENYRMIASDIRKAEWLLQIPKEKTGIILMEGVSMYLKPEECREVLKRWKDHFAQVRILMDSYTVFAAKATKYKNPINEVGVTAVYGVDDPCDLMADTGLTFLKEHSLTPGEMIAQLPNREQCFFKMMFAGKLAKKIYRLYEFR